MSRSPWSTHKNHSTYGHGTPVFFFCRLGPWDRDTLKMSKTATEKLKHNLVAKKGREKLNNLIGYLRVVIPELNTPELRECSKVVILQHTVSYIKAHKAELQNLEQTYQVSQNSFFISANILEDKGRECHVAFPHSSSFFCQVLRPSFG